MIINKRNLTKRLFDIFFSIFFLILLFPLFLIVSVLVLIFIGKPVFFHQFRPGIKERPFKLIKFRTMTNKTDLKGVLLKDTYRLNKFGKFLRSTSLDELPELWNILRGEMSFVGPRPLLMEYLPYYNYEQAKRHNVKPGITGWAQINGRNTISWEEKFEFDLWYVENQSLRLDIKILFITFKKVFFREGVTPKKGDIIPRFDESAKNN